MEGHCDLRNPPNTSKAVNDMCQCLIFYKAPVTFPIAIGKCHSQQRWLVVNNVHSVISRTGIKSFLGKIMCHFKSLAKLKLGVFWGFPQLCHTCSSIAGGMLIVVFARKMSVSDCLIIQHTGVELASAGITVFSCLIIKKVHFSSKIILEVILVAFTYISMADHRWLMFNDDYNCIFYSTKVTYGRY